MIHCSAPSSQAQHPPQGPCPSDGTPSSPAAAAAGTQLRRAEARLPQAKERHCSQTVHGAALRSVTRNALRLASASPQEPQLTAVLVMRCERAGSELTAAFTAASAAGRTRGVRRCGDNDPHRQAICAQLHAAQQHRRPSPGWAKQVPSSRPAPSTQHPAPSTRDQASPTNRRHAPCSTGVTAL